LVIRDGSPTHWRAAVKESLASKAGRRVWVEAPPAYALGLNPVEGAWQQLKHVELQTVTFLASGRRSPVTTPTGSVGPALRAAGGAK
jgi:hypothetical protein